MELRVYRVEVYGIMEIRQGCIGFHLSAQTLRSIHPSSMNSLKDIECNWYLAYLDLLR